ncbi:MAG: hypothetical protein ACKVRN_16430 [Pyrinomonadaceae bacterium]
MSKHWEQIGRDEQPNRWSAFHVTMSPDGVIVLGRFTLEMLGDAEAFHLLFDRLNHTIGLKPTKKDVRDAYPTAKRGRYGARLIRAFRLCQECNIRLPATVRFADPRIDEDGILNLDLRKVRPVKRGVPN